jgi:hypothetical protein
LNGPIKEIKKWIIPSKIVFALGGKTDSLMIIKPLEEKQNKHFTLVIRQNGDVDLHSTEEKPEKIHKTLAKGHINFDRLRSKVQMLYKQSIRPIRKDDQRYRDFLVLVPKDLKVLEDFYGLFVKGDQFVYPSRDKEQSIEKNLEKYFDISYFDEIIIKEPGFAFALSSSNRLYLLFFDQENRYLFPISQALEIVLKVIEWN